MFVINEDNSIYVTRGDTVFFRVTATENGEAHKFKSGDVVRMKVVEKKNYDNVVLQKDFPVTAETEAVDILLTENDTKIGGVISKPVDYWYEVELNPFDNPQTIIGYDEDGAKVFKLFPEGRDLTTEVEEEEIPVVDAELDLTSERPVQNQAIARAIMGLQGGIEANLKQYKDVDEMVKRVDATLKNTGFNYTLLWENPDPSDEFENEYITLGSDVMKRYSAFVVTYKPTFDYDLINTHYIVLLNNGYFTSDQMLRIDSEEGTKDVYKRSVMVDSEGIEFGNVETTEPAGVGGGLSLIPCKIYGVELAVVDSELKVKEHILLKDETTGGTYKLYVSNGKLLIEEREV